MAFGETKKPIEENQSDNVYLAVRLGGMGVAIGSSVGRRLAVRLMGSGSGDSADLSSPGVADGSAVA